MLVPQDVLERLSSDDVDLKDVNLNNVGGIEEKQMCEIFDSLRRNKNLARLSVVNCDVSLKFSKLLFSLQELKDQNMKGLHLQFRVTQGRTFRF